MTCLGSRIPVIVRLFGMDITEPERPMPNRATKDLSSRESGFTSPPPRQFRSTPSSRRPILDWTELMQNPGDITAV